MKVGILSMQRVINYGSFLQAYALKHMLEEIGCSVEFIDIKPGRHIIEKQYPSESKMKKISKLFDFPIRRYLHRFYRAKRNSRFVDEFHSDLSLSKEYRYDSSYDAIVIGSDEVFNCTQYSTYGFSKTLLGEGLDSGNIITYAASCGFTDVMAVEKLHIRDEVETALMNVKAFSVRDKNTYDFIKALTGRDALMSLDPVFIYDFTIENIHVPEKNYILVYGYDGRINDKETIKAVRRYAKKHHKKVICVGWYQFWCDKSVICTPLELLKWFKQADMVVTDTYHGTVLSLKMNTPFVTIVRDSNRNKITSLLDQFGLLAQIAESPDRIATILDYDVNFKDANTIIERGKQSAKDYLVKEIGIYK